MISTSELTFSYANGPQFHFKNMECASKDVLLILGRSGKGKTTLLHLLAGILPAEKGQVIIDQEDLTQLSPRALDQYRGENIGLIFQTAHFIKSLSVIDNLIMPAFLVGKKMDKKAAQQLLDRLNIGDKSNVFPHEMSIGEQQRLSIARAIINEPKVILADEPTSALDDGNAFEVMNLLEEEAKRTGSALIVVTHDTRLKDRYPNRIEL
ncbi:MAG: ABC transporter ATP-binding protein [Saprospiraceae bacterium]